MSEDRTEPLNEHSTTPTPFEQYVRDQFELILTRLDGVESGLRAELKRIESDLRADLSQVESGLRAEMVERFVQVSRQVRNLDGKIDIFIREHLEIKQDLREVRDSLNPKN